MSDETIDVQNLRLKSEAMAVACYRSMEQIAELEKHIRAVSKRRTPQEQKWFDDYIRGLGLSKHIEWVNGDGQARPFLK